MDIYANIDFFNQIKKQLLAGCHMDNQYVAEWGTLALINAGLAQGKKSNGSELVLIISCFRTACYLHLTAG
jgi:hypothetical protein